MIFNFNAVYFCLRLYRDLLNVSYNIWICEVKADSAAIKGTTNINELSLVGDNHEYISWEEIENKVGSAKTSDTNNNFVTIGIHLKDWDRYLKNTPVDEKDPLRVTKDMPFTCLEKLQEINTNSEFIKFG